MFFFRKKCIDHEKNKTYSRNCFLIQFHVLCANFRKIGWKIKKNAKFGDGPLCSIVCCMFVKKSHFLGKLSSSISKAYFNYSNILKLILKFIVKIV